MSERSFHRTEVNRSITVREALMHARERGQIVSHALLDDATRFIDEDLHRARPSTVELQFRRLGNLAATEAVLAGIQSDGLRPADLQETLALLRRRPELFLDRKNFPLQVLGERVRAPSISKKDCIPAFPEDGGAPPPALWLVERGNYLGAVVVLAAKL